MEKVYIVSIHNFTDTSKVPRHDVFSNLDLAKNEAKTKLDLLREADKTFQFTDVFGNGTEYVCKSAKENLILTVETYIIKTKPKRKWD